MKTRQVNTRFMQGNLDVECEIFDIMVNEYGMSEVCNSGINFEDAIYSNRFIEAIENGSIPCLELVDNSEMIRGEKEYHHVIIDDVCYKMYFN